MSDPAHGLGHDGSTSGTARLLRLPGFRNTKPEYPQRPMVRIVASRDFEPLQAARVLRFFGLSEKPRALAGNAMNIMQVAQSGGSTKPAYAANVARPGRGARDTAVETRVQHEAATGEAHNIDLETILETVSRVDPDCDYIVWFRVIAALHYMFGGDEDGLAIAEGWSSLAVEKYEPGCVNRVWTRLHTGREHVAHWQTLKAVAERYPFSSASRDRLNSMAFNELRVDIPCHLQIATPSFIWRLTTEGRPDGRAKQNADTLFEHVIPDLHFDLFGGKMRTNEGPLAKADFAHLWSLSHDLGCPMSHEHIRDSAYAFAQQRKRNSAQEWIEGLPDWDGVERLESVFVRHLGADNTLSIREMSKLLFIAMVRRIREPGCKFDYMPIIEGPQNLGKSAFVRLIVPQKDWFSDSLQFGMDEKRFYSQLQGKLLIEFPELDGKSKTEIGHIKKILTKQNDEYIPMYGKESENNQRIAVFIGTTNDSEYLRDMSDNRRFPIIPVTKRMDFDALEAERDQLWAEAVLLESVWGSLVLPDEAYEEVKEVQEDRLDCDTNVQEVLDRLEFLSGGFITNETMWIAMGFINKVQRTQGNGRYILRQLKERLRSKGWKNDRTAKERGLSRINPLAERPQIDYDEMHGLHYRPEVEL